MLIFIIIVAIIATNAGVVIGLLGAICGTACIYLLPSYLYDRCHGEKF